MIPRYSRDEMSAIWTDENKFKIWLEIETLACEALADLGVIPKEAAKDLRAKGNFDINKIAEYEKTLKHDVIAFLTSLADHVGENSRFVHQGMTSSDIIDTSFAVRLTQAADILLKDLDELLKVLKDKAEEHKNTLCMGRSHGIHAEPTTFGHKMASFYAEFKRNKKRLEFARSEIATCSISGAVGNYSTIDPRVEKYVAEKLELEVETVATQVIPRDRHAMFFAILGVIASSIERIAVEIRHLQRTEVSEASEFFSKGQKGSSAMPHKKNPIISENLTGIARLVRGYVTPSLENVALWHERDISHSSVERVTAADATTLLDFALVRLTGLIKNLLVYPENMEKNVNYLQGLIFSQKIMLALTQKDVSREEAYKIVQEQALYAWEHKSDFKKAIFEDPKIGKYLSKEDLTKIFDLKDYTKNIDAIFTRL